MWIKRASRVANAVLAAVAALCSAPLHATITLAPDRYGYQVIDSAEVNGPQFDYQDISATGTRLTNTVTQMPLGDDESAPIRFGFGEEGFRFYGKTYYTAFVSANGYISFVNSDNNYNPDNLPIPQPVGANGWQSPPFIAPWFDDLDPSAGGAIYYEVQGEAPKRRMVVQWSSVPHHNDHNAIFDFQVVLYESYNNILFQYRDINTTNTTLNNGTHATVGIQGGYEEGAGINYAGPITNNLAIGFMPVKYGYIGIPSGPQEQNGAPGQVIHYQVEVVNGKDVESDFTVEMLSGSRWPVSFSPTSIAKLAPGGSQIINVDVTVPATGSAAMDDDIVTLKVSDKVEEAPPSEGGTNGSTTNTQNNEQATTTQTSTVKKIVSLINLKTHCVTAPCFQQDSDGDGVPDNSEAATSVNDAAKVYGLAVHSNTTVDIEVGDYVEGTDKDGKTITTFQVCTTATCAFHGMSVEEAVNGPETKKFAEGIFNYRIIPSRVAESVTVRFTPPAPWSDTLVLYIVGSDGTYTEIDKDKKAGEKRWTRVENSNAVELPLVDGGDLDEDGVANGVIVNSLAFGVKAETKSNGDGFGSGALSVELLFLTAVSVMGYAARRPTRQSA